MAQSDKSATVQTDPADAGGESLGDEGIELKDDGGLEGEIIPLSPKSEQQLISLNPMILRRLMVTLKISKKLLRMRPIANPRTQLNPARACRQLWHGESAGVCF
jgi:hypothetical protein